MKEKKVKQTQEKKNVLKDVRTYFFGILSILAIVFIIQLVMFQLVPMKYLIPLLVILVLVLGVMWFLQYGKKVNKANKILGKVLIVFVAALLVVGNLYLYKGSSTLNSITGENKETNAISVIVLKDNDAKELSDVKDGTFGFNESADQVNISEALIDINTTLKKDVKTTTFTTYNDMVQALYDKEVDAVILNEAYRGLLEEKFEKFDDETKVIYQHNIDVEVESIQKAVDVTKNPFTVYISGIDTYGPVNTRSRSDVNMIATVNPTTKEILLTSIPRDYYTSQACQGGQKDKLTHTGIFGVDCTVSTVENLFGITINYYARVNFTSLLNIVDSLGGITVVSDIAFSGGGYSFNVGENYLDGKKALAFSRERYSLSNGDIGRGMNQTKVLTGIINKAISPAIITNYNSVMDSISGSFQTNMETSDITSLIKMQLGDMSGWTINSIGVVGSGATLYSPANGFNSYMMVPDEASMQAAISRINSVINGK